MNATIFASVDSLRSAGFTGFVSIRELRECKLQCVPGKPGDIGVYLVLRVQTDIPVFLKKSTGGFFKKQDPSVAVDILKANWVRNTLVVYIGKAGTLDGKATLRSRLRQYLSFGAGRAIGHWGGRMIWHLPQSEDLLVCWKRTPNLAPRDVEKQMIRAFTEAFGNRPFANLTD
jgi:hypothetical protein